MIIGYSGVESHYGGGDEIWIESSLSDVDEEEKELYEIIPSNISIDDYIINKYT